MSFVYPAEQWVEAFALTLWIEVPLCLIALRHTSLSFVESFCLAIGVNVFTHPALWYVFPKWSAFPPPFDDFYIWLVLAEGCVVLVEGLFFQLATGKTLYSFLLAFFVNLLSTLVGLYM